MSGQWQYVSSGTDDPPALSVYQAWWGMMGLGTGGREWTDEEKVARLERAGFDGVLVFDPPRGDEGARFRELLDRHGLELAVGTFAATPAEIERDLAWAGEMQASFLNVQMMDYFLRGEPALEALREVVRLGLDAGLPCLVETHRACVTQDLLRTADYVRALPEMLLAIDLSHFVVAGQIPVLPGELWSIRPEIEELFDLLLARTACFHGRVSNGHQVQIDIGREGEHPATAHFGRWWEKGMAKWLRRAGQGDRLPFVCELGPPGYSITLRSPDGATEAETSDRWQQALVMREVAYTAWLSASAAATA